MCIKTRRVLTTQLFGKKTINNLKRTNRNWHALLDPVLHNTDSHTCHGSCAPTMSPHVMFRVNWCNLSFSCFQTFWLHSTVHSNYNRVYLLKSLITLYKPIQQISRRKLSRDNVIDYSFDVEFNFNRNLNICWKLKWHCNKAYYTRSSTVIN